MLSLEHDFISLEPPGCPLTPIFSDYIFHVSCGFATWQLQLKICLLLPTPSLLFLSALTPYNNFIIKNLHNALYSLFSQQTFIDHLPWPHDPAKLTDESSSKVLPRSQGSTENKVIIQDILWGHRRKWNEFVKGRLVGKVTFDRGLDGWNGIFQKPKRKPVTLSRHKGMRPREGDTELYSPGFSKAAPKRKKGQFKQKTREHKPVAVRIREPEGPPRVSKQQQKGRNQGAGETEEREGRRGTVEHFTV